MVFVSLIISRL